MHRPSPPPGGDEFDELSSALDTMSTELTSRRTELEGERARLKTTLARYGETLAATHDQRALLEAVLDTAVQATRARGGRLLLYDSTNGEASEEVRHGHRPRLACRPADGRHCRCRHRGRRRWQPGVRR